MKILICGIAPLAKISFFLVHVMVMNILDLLNFKGKKIMQELSRELIFYGNYYL